MQTNQYQTEQWHLLELLYENNWVILIALLTMTGVQSIVISNNNKLLKKTGLDKIYLISKQGKF